MEIYKHVEIQRLSASTITEKGNYLLSYNGRYYEASYPIVEFLRELQESETEEEAISSYIKKKEDKYTFEQLHGVIDKFITPLFSVKKNKRTFLYEKKLFTASSIDKFSNTFQFLFNKAYMAIIFAVVLIMDIYFFLTTDNLLQFNNKVNIYMIIGLLVFMLLSSLFHELGHASACKYFGVRHGGIGFGLYLNFPVLYTDVIEVWRLKRIERCVVNIAGVYFQTFWLTGLLLGFILTGNDILRYLILIVNLGFIMTLNPFFKFDGYWIVSDFFGVPNLSIRSKELIVYYYKRILKRPVIKIPYILKIRSAEKYGILVYSILVNLFMGFYFFYIIPCFIYRFIQTFPGKINELILYLSNNMAPPFALLRNIGSQLLFLGLLGYLLWKMLNPLIKKYARK